MWNNGNEEGCIGMYRGALAVAIPLLDHRPELKRNVQVRLQRAETAKDVESAAFTLRESLDDIRAAIRKDAVPAPAAKTLWDRLGGETAVRAVQTEAIKQARSDPKVNFSRGGKFQVTPEINTKTVQLLVELLSSATGGPLKYTGRDMKTVHKGMGINDAEFDALGAIVVKVMVDAKVGSKEISEVVAVVNSLRKDIVEAKTLWERLGGEEAVKKVVHDAIDAVIKDPKVNLTRDGKFKMTPENVARLEKLHVEFISAATGGPLKYSGLDMKTAHAGMAISAAEFDAVGGHIVATMKKYKVPQKEIDEFAAIFNSAKKDVVEKK
jgi:hemoglobin